MSAPHKSSFGGGNASNCSLKSQKSWPRWTKFTKFIRNRVKIYDFRFDQIASKKMIFCNGRDRWPLSIRIPSLHVWRYRGIIQTWSQIGQKKIIKNIFLHQISSNLAGHFQTNDKIGSRKCLNLSNRICVPAPHRMYRLQNPSWVAALLPSNF